MNTENKIVRLIIHCTATTVAQAWDKKMLLHQHLVLNGWRKPGYHHFIELDGTVHNLVEYNEDPILSWGEIAYGAGKYNGTSLHICYSGGLGTTMFPKDTRTLAQKGAMIRVIEDIIKKFPDIKIIGHNQLPDPQHNKACPSFWVPTWLRDIGIDEKHIWNADTHGYNKYFNK